MKHVSWKKVVSLLTALVLCLSLAAIPAFAVEPTADTPFVNVSDEIGRASWRERV